MNSSVEQYSSALCLRVVMVMTFSLQAWAVVKWVYLSDAEGFLYTVVWMWGGDLMIWTSKKEILPSISISLVHLIVGCVVLR